MIRVVVVDDESLVRSGLELILRAAGDVEVVATCSGDDAVREIGVARPDVVLLDIRMPGVDGLTVLRSILARRDAPTVAMLTTFDTDEYVRTALAQGASGFLLKDTDPVQLVQSVRALAAGAVVLSPRATRSVRGGGGTAEDERAARERVAMLTGREREVLGELTRGLSNAEIARAVHLSASTVKDHISVILGKLDVTSRVQAALLAQRAGLPIRLSDSGGGRPS